MKILTPISPAALPKVHVRSFFQTMQQARPIIKHKKRVHIPRSTHPTRSQVLMGKDPWSRWRRMWLAYIAHLWTTVLSSDDRDWWITEAATIPFYSHRGVNATRNGLSWFLHYQFRCVAAKMTRYIPFGANAADFPKYYTPPWNPPTLEAPTIVSATLPPSVIVRCLNKTPGNVPLDPLCWWLINPPLTGLWGLSSHPWYQTGKADSGDHSNYTYNLAPIFPKLKTPARALLIHAYGLNPVVTTARPATIATSTGAPPLVPWLNLVWAEACDNLGASTDWSTGSDSETLACTDPDFSSLTDAPLGIQLTIRRWAWNSQVTDTSVRLLKGGSPAGDDKAAAGQWSQVGYVNKTYGGATDLWGTTWTLADIQSSGFGGSLSCHSATPSGAAFVDCMTLTVWTPGGKYQFTTPTLTPFAFPS